MEKFLSEDGKILDGLVDMTNDEYHAGPGISKSHLDVINAKSDLHYWYKYLNPHRQPEIPTPAKILGTAIHTAILEPDLLDAHVVCGLEIDKRSNANKAEWAAYEAEHAGKIILPSEKYADVLAIRDAVHRHPVARGLLTGGQAEQSFFATDEETGELIKCRTDYLLGSLVLDVKSTEDASPAEFGKSAYNYRYDVQVAWYYGVMKQAVGEEPEHWAFLAFEKEPPYAIGIYFAEKDMIDRARKVARENFERIVALRKQTAWPDYGFTIEPLQFPAWARR